MRSPLAAAALILTLATGWARAAVVEHRIRPSAADPALRTFDDPNIALYASSAPPDAPLVVFMPGTGGRPEGALGLLRTVAEAGRPVIGLEYADDPAVVQVCAHDPDTACSEDFRRVRIYGEGKSKYVANGKADAIAGRLAALLGKLARDYPGEGWSRYVTAAGEVEWSRVVVSGQSQGAGMAAFIAKRTPVARVVLFSSPWDFQGPPPRLAPWIAGPSATPPERWYGAYNSRENTAALLAQSYRALNLPPDHVRVLALDLAAGAPAVGPNPYHPAGVHDHRYAADWRFLYGVDGAAH